MLIDENDIFGDELKRLDDLDQDDQERSGTHYKKTLILKLQFATIIVVTKVFDQHLTILQL